MLLRRFFIFDEGLDDVAEKKENAVETTASTTASTTGQEQGGSETKVAAKAATKTVTDGAGQQGENVQEQANHSAKLGARALSRMGGYLKGKYFKNERCSAKCSL